MTCPRIPYILMVMIALMQLLGCSARTFQLTETAPIETTASTESRLGEFRLIKNRGHVVITLPEKNFPGVTLKSLQQPDARIEPISDTQTALLNLLPQKHTIVASIKTESVPSFAVFKDVTVDPQAFIDLGVPSFEKPGSLKGTLLSPHSTPLSDALIALPELNLQTRTQSDGAFVFAEIPAGTWLITANSAEFGSRKPEPVQVASGQIAELGDLWTGTLDLSFNPPQLLNGAQGVVSEKEASVKLHLPQGARTVSVKGKDGEVYVEKAIARQNMVIPLKESMKTELNFFIYDSSMRLLGTQSLPLVYDPFSSVGVPFKPQVKIAQRVLSSPQLALSLELLNTPSKASQVRFAVDGIFGGWQSPQVHMTVQLPKANTTCGQRKISVQFSTVEGLLSSVTTLPITLSCWERIPHTAALDKIMGVDNAAVWTGTHAFVWSGRQFDLTRRASIWGGSNSAETTEYQKDLQTYRYSEAGYIFQPKIDPITKNLVRSQMELIVTDSAPTARAFAGVGGLNNFVAIYGGENEQGSLADGAIFDINRNGWVSMMGEGAPSPRIKPSVHFIDENRILVWGGTTKTNLGYELPLNDGAIYNQLTHEWIRMPSLNVPSARMRHVGVWTGSEFFVMGGILPGGIEVYTAGKYNPTSNTWQALPNLPYPLTYTSAVHKNGYLFFYGRNNTWTRFKISDSSFTEPLRATGLSQWMINPSMVFGEHSSDASKSILYVFGGSGSLIGSDANDTVTLFEHSADQFDYKGSAKIFTTAIETSTNREIANCCFDMLGFNFNGHVFAINGTEVSNTSVYSDIRPNQFADGSTTNYTTTVEKYKTLNFRTLRFVSSNSTIFSPLFSLPENKVSGGNAAVGPYYLHRTNPPIWDPQNRSLLWYGGIYQNPTTATYLQGGLVYNLDSRSWSQIPVATSEPNYLSASLGTQYYSRFDAIHFMIGNTFFMLGGYNYTGTNGAQKYLFDGLSSSFNSGAFAAPQPILPTAADQAHDYTPLGTAWSGMQWDTQPICVGESHALLSGGWRKAARATPGIDDNKALVQDKVVFDSGTNALRRATSGPLGVRAGSAIVSTGTECIVWGGYSADAAQYKTNATELISELAQNFSPQGDGAIYSFATDQWRTISSTNSPSSRAFVQGVWTGQDALLWGGSTNYSPSVAKPIEAGPGTWMYSPSTNSWRSLPAAQNEPRFTGEERPVWTGRHMFIWKHSASEHSFQFTPESNTWTKISMPFGFNFRTNAFWDSHVVWTGHKLFVMPYYKEAPAIMALFVPPDP